MSNLFSMEAEQAVIGVLLLEPDNFDKISELYGFEISLNKLYCRFHGKIIEFMKSNKL